MNQLSNQHITCPYCGENIELVVDCSIPDQEYIEDCEVCCRPISLFISINERQEINISPKHENE
jgi:cysteine-rich CPXCG protein